MQKRRPSYKRNRNNSVGMMELGIKCLVCENGTKRHSRWRKPLSKITDHERGSKCSSASTEPCPRGHVNMEEKQDDADWHHLAQTLPCQWRDFSQGPWRLASLLFVRDACPCSLFHRAQTGSRKHSRKAGVHSPTTTKRGQASSSPSRSRRNPGIPC